MPNSVRRPWIDISNFYKPIHFVLEREFNKFVTSCLEAGLDLDDILTYDEWLTLEYQIDLY